MGRPAAGLKTVFGGFGGRLSPLVPGDPPLAVEAEPDGNVVRVADHGNSVMGSSNRRRRLVPIRADHFLHRYVDMHRVVGGGLLFILACGPETEAGTDTLTVEFASMEGQCIDPCPGGEFYGYRRLDVRVTAGNAGWTGTVSWLPTAESSNAVASENVTLDPGESAMVELEDDGCPSGPEGTRQVVVFVETDDVVWELEGEYFVGMGYDC